MSRLASLRRPVAAAGAAFVLMGGWMAPARSAGPVTLNLRATDAMSLPQGEAFGYEVELVNSAPESLTVTLAFWLTSLADGRTVAFTGGALTVQGSETVTSQEGVTSSQWFRRTGTFQLTATVEGELSDDTVEFDVTAPEVSVPYFRDVTAMAGLDTELPESECGKYTAGAAWGDADGDDDLDLYVPRKLAPAQLWMNDGGGRFADEAQARGADNPGRDGVGAVFADYDNDGDQDLYVVNDGGPNRLYRNDGTGLFVDIAAQAGVDTEAGDASAAWGDYDADGHLDLYVVSNSPCEPPVFYEPDTLYHNEGDGTFTDQTALLPEDSTMGAGFQAAWWDYDGDHDVDLYLANDDWGPVPDPNHLWRNDGPDGEGGWRFTDVSGPSRTAYLMNSMGIGLGDYDRDLDLDMAISNIGSTVLARNNGDGTFTDVAEEALVDRPYQTAGVASITWGLVFTDLNLDGWEDLFVAAGHTADVPGQPEEVFVNGGDGAFLDLTALSGTAHRGSSRGVAVADFDRDGRVDLYVVDMAGSPRLYRNLTDIDGRHWLEVKLTGTTSNRDACGARLVLVTDDARLLRQVFCGSTSLSSGGDPAVHFGLGADAQPARLIIRWPSGQRQVVAAPAVDQLLEITEP